MKLLIAKSRKILLCMSNFPSKLLGAFRSLFLM